MNRLQPSDNFCLVHSFQPMQLFCFRCKYFYCQICCDENRNHDDHSDTIIHLPSENFEFERYLGSGKNAACVFRVIDLEDGHGYAVKIFSNVRKWEIEQLFSETQFSVNISHPNIIEYKRSYDIKEENLFVIITELADRSLQSEITYITQTKAFSYFIQIMEALHYLHDDLKILQGNLKISNILVKQDVIKLSDLGDILGRKMLTLSSNRDNTLYLPPEIINGQDIKNEKSDIWAAGIIFQMMLSRGKHPFDIEGTRNDGKIVENVKNNKFKYDESIRETLRDIPIV